MNVKKCTVEPKPKPPPPDPCKLQRIKLKERAGIKMCPPPIIEDPPPAPECIAICIERIKNPPVPPSSDFPVVCAVDPIETPQPIPSKLEDRFGGPSRKEPPPKPCKKTQESNTTNKD